MCHPRKEGDDHAKGLATSSADPGKILARFWSVVHEEEKEDGCGRIERTEAYTYILIFTYTQVILLVCSLSSHFR